jgi:hypothetical protein
MWPRAKGTWNGKRRGFYNQLIAPENSIAETCATAAMHIFRE